MTSAASLVEQVREGASRELQLMAASGVLPVSSSDLIPLQIDLATGGDREIAGAAMRSLRELDPKLLVAYLEHDASNRDLNYFALEIADPKAIETILRRRDVSTELLVALAPTLSEELQEILLLRQDMIVEQPGILDALEKNPALSRYASRRIAEYRQHLLPRAAAPPVPEPGGEIEEASDEEVKEALDRARAESPPAPEAEIEESLGLAEAQIRSLPAPVRMRLTRGASRGLRALFLRDPLGTIATACLRNNNFSDQEIEQACLSRATHEDALAVIARDRQYTSRYPIVLALVKNPKAPVGNSVRLVPRLAVRDLRDLRRDRNVPDPVRKTADRLYRIKVG